MNLVQLPHAAGAPGRTVAAAGTEAERLARLRLTRSENVGPRTFLHLLGRYGSAQRALEHLPELARRGGRAAAYRACAEDQAVTEIEQGLACGARLVMLGDADYPATLAAIDSPPPVLWIRGATAFFQRPAVAVVGARNASALGMRTARRLARELGLAGRVVVSGLARGIDAAAHEATLETGTIGVLAGGIDRVYPEENAGLAHRMIDAGGALVAECPVGTEPTSRHFPRRNRLISGMAHGVVLIEAAVRSGSLITARFALDQGREVMACPGAPEDPRSGGCNQLIREGAALIRTAEDVLDALTAPRALQLSEEGAEFLFDGAGFDADSFADELSRDEFEALADFDEEEGESDGLLAEQVLDLLGASPVEIDEIARITGSGPSELSLALLELDLAGRIDLLPGGLVARADGG
ncbi:DNA-protecting protein DprA [Limibaculum sp. M0105]|uniref:DNA-protecting protein DprA n=1 Tax=Thermohalobaculum xanthum TaxID=2753746 RepID=A0A8J7MAF7_9RHOB|nr:DNA-processing protein DprA [Thermohalobaculum xanthum]MBK0401245.1 DNA-protecting protein DprA [Thermohalobaculum xanthum]